jgi:hypothetical protein
MARREYRYQSEARSTVPVAAACPSCGARILIGWLGEARVLALDAEALSLLGETQALIAGLATYEVSGFGMIRRGAEAIKYVPQPVVTDIHREHRCGTKPIEGAEKRIPKPAKYWGDDPPF